MAPRRWPHRHRLTKSNIGQLVRLCVPCVLKSLHAYRFAQVNSKLSLKIPSEVGYKNKYLQKTKVASRVASRDFPPIVGVFPNTQLQASSRNDSPIIEFRAHVMLS